MGSQLFIRQWGQREDRPCLRIFRRHPNLRYYNWITYKRLGAWRTILFINWGIAFRGRLY